MGPEPKKKLRSGARARARARFLDEVPFMAFLCPFLYPFDSGGTYGGHKAFFMSFSTLTLLVSEKDICPFCKEPIGCYKRTYVLSEVDAE